MGLDRKGCAMEILFTTDGSTGSYLAAERAHPRHGTLLVVSPAP